ncbi:N-acetylglucosamine-1-phosphodiester alpha-N-acetylglucosaminidase-like [Saccostrea cucullata]|uniref:N-acetylglucosamine-1-phosphodiester alpha-N-acetylglucosaminidase-like n=1 Tax=Saccostrea cuccullata TaxID=36930 RepID=UPI002ED0E768
MELIYFFFVLAFQFWFSLTNGLINGPGICWYNRNKSGCCQNYKEVDGSCQYIRGLIDGPGVCKDNGGNLRCCTNYQRKDTDCIPCELGTYGVNCTGGPCKYGYYGFGCSKKCHCTTDQLCDRKIGCARHLNTTNCKKTLFFAYYKK